MSKPMTTWGATHAIDIRRVGKREIIRVMLLGELAYTQSEWSMGVLPSWERVDGEWRLHGSIPACEAYTVTPLS